MDHWIQPHLHRPLEGRAFPLPSSHLCHPESCFPAALPRSMRASVCSKLPRSAPPLHPACVGQGMGAELLPWGWAGIHPISCLSLSGVHSRNVVVLWWVGAVVSAPRAAERCYVVWTLLSWENAAGSGGRQPSSPGGSQSGNHRGRDVHKAPRRAGASPRPSAIPESAHSMGAFSPSFSNPSRCAPQQSQNPAFVRIF